MKMTPPYIIVLLLALGCAHSFPQQGLMDPILAHPAPALKENATAFEAAAWHLFRKADYVRALNLAYQATEIEPQEPSAALLIGLIYDHGFNRPDLALSAYNHIMLQASNHEGVRILQPRLPYLFRRTQERIAQISLDHNETHPLEGTPLALFPILPWIPNKTDAAFALGLTDILFSDLLDTNSKLPTLRTHLLAHAFLDVFPNADAKAFAQWVGADQTLSGTMIRGHNHQISIALTLTNAQGQTIRDFPPVVGKMDELDLFREAISQAVTQAIDLTTPDFTGPMPSSLALTLFGRGLDAYLAADPEQARIYFSGARDLAPKAERITQLQEWVEADYLGSQIGQDLLGLYRSIRSQPNPDEAAARRILATQHFLMPSTGLGSAQEPLQPFKSPKPETAQ